MNWKLAKLNWLFVWPARSTPSLSHWQLPKSGPAPGLRLAGWPGVTTLPASGVSTVRPATLLVALPRLLVTMTE